MLRAEDPGIGGRKIWLMLGDIFDDDWLPGRDMLYQLLREIVTSGRYGGLKRVNWIVTDWYRPNKYYSSSSWHATWAKDGGGVLLNQCPHNLDLLQWICGMPARVQGFCIEGHFHDIEVEDDVTIYKERENEKTDIHIGR